MKNLKEHKVQILAAMALAFSLGMVMPSAVFASDGEPVVQAENATTAATSTDLYNAIETAKKEENYNLYYQLWTAQTALAADLNGAKEAEVKAVTDAVVAINKDAQIAGMTAEQLNNFVLAMDGYSDWAKMFDAIANVNKATDNATLTAQVISEKMSAADIQKYYNIIDGFNNRVTGTLAENIVKLVDRINTRATFANYRSMITLMANVATLEDEKASESAVTAAATAVKAELATWKPTVANIDKMTNAELAETVRGNADYAKYFALYDAMGFVRALTPNGETLTAEEITKLDASAQVAGYTKIAAAANAIDNTVMKGLMAYELPETGAPTTDVEAPDTGIVGLIESGALDMATLTLIASVALASVAGFGLIAKLYLKHKF